MAILVHDGSEGFEYDSYASLEEADAHHATRATPEWLAAEDEGVREAALVRATDYIDATYDFAEGPVSDGAVNPLVVKATIVLAAYALNDTLSAKRDRDVIEVEQELSGVGKTRTKYGEGQIADPYPLVSKILSPITGSVAGSIAVGRVTR